MARQNEFRSAPENRGGTKVSSATLKPGSIVRGSLFPELVQVIVCTSLGASMKLIGKGLDSGRVYEPVLDAGQVASLHISPDQPPFDGDPLHFRLGIEALRLTAIWFWVMKEANGNGNGRAKEDTTRHAEEPSEADDDDAEENGQPAVTKKAQGFAMEFDAARKLAQGLGVCPSNPIFLLGQPSEGTFGVQKVGFRP